MVFCPDICQIDVHVYINLKYKLNDKIRIFRNLRGRGEGAAYPVPISGNRTINYSCNIK